MFETEEKKEGGVMYSCLSLRSMRPHYCYAICTYTVLRSSFLSTSLSPQRTSSPRFSLENDNIDHGCLGSVDQVLNFSSNLAEFVLELRSLLVDIGRSRLVSNFITTLFDDGRVVGLPTTVPCQDVGSILGNISESTDGSNRDDVSLELLGCDVCDGVSGVLGWLERDHVGQETADVRRSHRGAGDDVGGILGADPGGEDVQTGRKDIVALAKVGEVGTFVRESRSSDSDGVLSGSRRIVARVGVVIAGSDSEVKTSINGCIDSQIEGARFAATQAHVGNGALEMLLLAFLCGGDRLSMGSSSPLNTLDNVGHGARAIGLQDLDCVNACLLSNTKFLASDSAGAVSSVAVAIDVFITSRNGLAPVGATFEINVLNVCTGINDIGINTLTSILRVEILVEGSETEAIAM